MADFLAWIMRQYNVLFLLHYLDDFLMKVPANSLIFQCNLDIITQICDYLGVPLALEKVEAPSLLRHPPGYSQNGSLAT